MHKSFVQRHGGGRFKAFAVLAVPVLLAACATATSSRYYSLQPAAAIPDAASQAARVPMLTAQDSHAVKSGSSSGVSTASPSGASGNRGMAYALGVQSVTVPAQVDRPQIVLNGRDDASVTLLNGSLWASPLTDEIRLAVSSDLSRELGVPVVQQSEVSGKLPVWRVGLNFQRFDSVYNQRAVVGVNWRITPPEKSSLGSAILCTAVASASAAGTGVQGLVQAHRRILAQLSSIMAAQISALQTEQPIEQALIEGHGTENVAVQWKGCSVL